MKRFLKNMFNNTLMISFAYALSVYVTLDLMALAFAFIIEWLEHM